MVPKSYSKNYKISNVHKMTMKGSSANPNYHNSITKLNESFPNNTPPRVFASNQSSSGSGPSSLSVFGTEKAKEINLV